MTTTTLSISPSNIGPNGKTSPGLNLPANTYYILARLVCSSWPTQLTADTLNYQIDYMDTSGTWQNGSPSTIQVGQLSKDGGLPLVGYGFDGLQTAKQVRLVASCTTTMKIGADITIYSN